MMSIVQAALDPKRIDLKTKKLIINVYLPKDLQTTLEERMWMAFCGGGYKRFPSWQFGKVRTLWQLQHKKKSAKFPLGDFGLINPSYVVIDRFKPRYSGTSLLSFFELF